MFAVLIYIYMGAKETSIYCAYRQHHLCFDIGTSHDDCHRETGFKGSQLIGF